MVALIPFSECAARKISSSVSRSSGASSIRMTARFRASRCSRLSARNMLRYSEVSTQTFRKTKGYTGSTPIAAGDETRSVAPTIRWPPGRSDAASRSWSALRTSSVK